MWHQISPLAIINLTFDTMNPTAVLGSCHMFYPVVRLYSLTLLYYTLAGVGVQSETQPFLFILFTDSATLCQPGFSMDT